MIKDKVVKVKEDGEYNGRPKWKVQTQRSGEYTFFTNFSAVAGDIIEFSVNNEKYKTAKLLEVVDSKIPKAGKSNYDTGQSILRQVAFKGAIEIVTNTESFKLEDIEELTNKFHIILNNPVK